MTAVLDEQKHHHVSCDLPIAGSSLFEVKQVRYMLTSSEEDKGKSGCRQMFTPAVMLDSVLHIHCHECSLAKLDF